MTGRQKNTHSSNWRAVIIYISNFQANWFTCLCVCTFCTNGDNNNNFNKKERKMVAMYAHGAY